MKYSIKKENGVIRLQGDGKDKICPFQQPVPMKTQLGGLQMIPVACSDQCPHFGINKSESALELTCGGSTRLIELEKTEENKPGLIL